mmetsp:Transcript_47396/g.116134  ORF Transcript_47396/g.116134 Transcript_47396/m.116134 type:complete len:278 (-) Transcript_47396:86-919(-)
MDVSDQEAVQICTKFMLSAPPGEFMEVVTDIRGLLTNEGLLNASAPATFRQYNQEQMLVVQPPGAKHKVLITEHGEAAPGKYVDPRGQQLVLFDHIQQKVTGKEPIGNALDAGAEAMRKAFEDAAFKYADDHYPDGAATVYAKGKVITVCIQSSKYNPDNFWNGRWRSVWQCTLTGSKVQLKGNMRIQVHYYEDGNVQLNTNTNKTASVAQGDPAASAAAAIGEIKQIEQQFAKSLENSYSTLGDTTFKALRRALPITRTKIDWDKILHAKVRAGRK